MNNTLNPNQPIVETVRVLDGVLEHVVHESGLKIYEVTNGRVTFYATDGSTKTLEVTDTGITFLGAPVGYVRTTKTVTLADFTEAVTITAGQILDLAIYADRSADAAAAVHVEIMNWKNTHTPKVILLSSASATATGLDVVISINVVSATSLEINIKNALGGNLTYSYTTRMLM